MGAIERREKDGTASLAGKFEGGHERVRERASCGPLNARADPNQTTSPTCTRSSSASSHTRSDSNQLKENRLLPQL